MTTLCSTSASAERAALDHSHSQWDGIPAKHLRWTPGGHDWAVDYAALNREPKLNVYLESLSGVPETEFRAWTPRQQSSFLLNAYNAYTVALVASRYPIESIKDIGGWSSPWSCVFVPLFGNKVSLDHIEHDLIRARGHRDGYADPRIHFAVNCASRRIRLAIERRSALGATFRPNPSPDGLRRWTDVITSKVTERFSARA